MKNDKWFFTISSIIFTVVAIAHMAIIFYALPIIIDGYIIPLWCSAVAVLLAGYLATRGFIAAHRLG